MEIRPFLPGDEVAICDIYNHYVTDTTATLEEDSLLPSQIRERIDGYLLSTPGSYVLLMARLSATAMPASFTQGLRIEILSR